MRVDALFDGFGQDDPDLLNFSVVVTHGQGSSSLTEITAIHRVPLSVSNCCRNLRNLMSLTGRKTRETIGRDTMTTIAPNRHSRPVMRCVQCGDELLAPEWSEYRNEREARYLWSCWKCDCCFETVAKIEPIEDIKTRDDILPTLLVADSRSARPHG